MSGAPKTLPPVHLAGPRLLAMLAWLWLLVALPFLTDASCVVFVGLALTCGWLGLGVAWLLLPLVARGALSTGARRAWYVAAAAAGVLGLVLAFTDVGLTARVAISDPGLTAYVEEVTSGAGKSPLPPRWVGLFRVNRTLEYDGVVVLFTSQDFIDEQGVAYIPPGKQLPSRFHPVRHLYGHWFWFNWHF
jgi:hypothetical protein